MSWVLTKVFLIEGFDVSGSYQNLRFIHHYILYYFCLVLIVCLFVCLFYLHDQPDLDFAANNIRSAGSYFWKYKSWTLNRNTANGKQEHYDIAALLTR